MKIIFPFCMDNYLLQSSFINLDSTLARGLNYYTGTIIEVKPPPAVKLAASAVAAVMMISPVYLASPISPVLAFLLVWIVSTTSWKN